MSRCSSFACSARDRKAASWKLVDWLQGSLGSAFALERLPREVSRELIGNLLHIEDLPESIRGEEESRTGMGRCRGRNCSSSVAATIARLMGRDISEMLPPTVRPPLKPVPDGAIAEQRHQIDAPVQVE